MDAIDRYACTGCREMRLAVTTYKVHNSPSSTADNTAHDDDDENNPEYDDGADDASDSGDSADSEDSDDEPVVSSVGTRKRPATSQPALSFPVKKKKKGKVARSGAKKGVKSSRGSKAGWLI